MTELTKPTKKVRTKPAYDYFTVSNYMQKKYNFIERDFAGKYEGKTERIKALEAKYPTVKYSEWASKKFTDMEGDELKFKDELYAAEDNIPYQDFWHFICDELSGNDSYMYVNYTDIATDDTLEDWQRQIAQYYVDEFGEEASEMYFWVSW